ncbi:MAG: phospho-N-acetylmuramoyl-pentapeptide-transferase [Finegoldia sp.]|nr:phospho-N-acetylmuramoyl-pentapeptide-transferase [Finegoldia sp.]
MDIRNKILLAFLVSTLISIFLGNFVIKKLRKMHIGQEIRDDGPKTHFSKAGTPTMGGIIFVITILVTLLIFKAFSKESAIGVFGMLAFGMIGFIDDFKKLVMKRSLGLTEKQKIIFQFVFAIVACIFIKAMNPDFSKQVIPFLGKTVNLGFFIYPFLIFVFIGTVNATNLTDGLDGLLTTVSLPIFLALSIIFLTISIEISSFCAIFAGSLLGFYVYNSNPARVFMGDTGSMAIGGALALIMAYKGMIFYLLILGAIYVIEAMSVIIQVASYKLRNKKRVFLMSPIHHHYELKGYPEQKIVAVFSVISALLSVLTVIDFM